MSKIRIFIIAIMLFMNMSAISQSPTISFNTTTPFITGLTQSLDIVNSGDATGRLLLLKEVVL